MLKSMSSDTNMLERTVRLLTRGIGSDVGGRYHHWDKLRHLTPPEGIDAEQWWFAIKMARLQQRVELPLRDRAGRNMHFVATPLLQPYLRFIDQHAAGNLKAPADLVGAEDRNRYLFSMVSDEAITSSQLEGASTTRNVARELIRSGRAPINRSERMILNTYRAMEFVRSAASSPLSIDLLLKLHRLVTEDTLEDASDEGRVRTTDDIIIKDERDTILHIPPSAHELSARLNDLIAFANAEPPSNIHPVVHAIMLHFWLAYDHPFVDGNGRTARLLFYWSMLHHGYWLAEFLSISTVLKSAPAQYAKSYLYTETDEHDVTYFILHQLHTIQRSIEALYAYLRRKQQEMVDARARLAHHHKAARHLNHRQVALLTHALQHPHHRYTIRTHHTSHGISYLTARSDLKGLVDLHLLDQVKIGTTHYYIAPADLNERIA